MQLGHSDTFNKYFMNIAEGLNLYKSSKQICESSESEGKE